MIEYVMQKYNQRTRNICIVPTKKGKHIVKLYPSDAVLRKWKCVCINKRHLRQKNSLGLKTV